MDDPDNSHLDDAVAFELPTYEHVEAFGERFRSRWPGWSHEDAEVWLFFVELLAPTEDLPILLREAQDLAGQLGLATLRFYVDGRRYTLRPPHVERTATRSTSGAER